MDHSSARETSPQQRLKFRSLSSLCVGEETVLCRGKCRNVFRYQALIHRLHQSHYTVCINQVNR